MKSKLDHILNKTIQNCFKKGVLKETALPDYVIEIPNNPGHGHFATNLPMTLASSQKRNPKEIAKAIVKHLVDDKKLIEKAEIAGPGFINFLIIQDEWHRNLERIISYRMSGTGI
ncbi:MAG: hypothetical protein JRJ02_16645 [Deltaproteobacteria bacterium]|nr:hypothetical protein [Deltaproteobacteria bacterium]